MEEIKKGYPIDSEGAESEEEMISYDSIISTLWENGILGCKSVLVGEKFTITQNVWVYYPAILLDKMMDKIKGVLYGLPVKISLDYNKEEITIRIV